MLSGFYVGIRLTMADLAMYKIVGWVSGGLLEGLPTNLVHSFPQVNANFQATAANHKVKAYLEEKYPGK